MTDCTPLTPTTAQAARRLNRSPEWVSQLLTAGRIKGEKVGRYWHVDAASLEEFIANGRRKRGRHTPPEAAAPMPVAAAHGPEQDGRACDSRPDRARSTPSHGPAASLNTGHL